MTGKRGIWQSVGVGAALAGTLLTGCTKKDAAPPAPRAGWVRLNPLVESHPLMAEVERLRRVEQAFDQQAIQGTLGNTAAGVVLPALPTLGAVRENANLAQRRQAQRRSLQQAAQQGLLNYRDGRALRRQRLYEQRRTELAAALRARDVDAERLDRLAVEQETGQKLDALASQRLEIEARLAVLNGQIEQEALTPGPALEKDLESEISRLQADPAVQGISPRARLTLRSRREQALLDAVLAQIASVTQQGRARVAALAATAQRARDAEIEAQLNNLQQGNVLASIGAGQQQALQNVLAAEARSARLERQVIQTAASFGPRGGAAALRVDSSLDETDVAGLGLQEAVQRIRRQRQNLQQFIVESVAEAVRDTAHQQNIAVTLVPSRATEAGSEAATGAARRGSDMTQDFLRWIRWGEPLPRSGKIPSVSRTPQAGARGGGKDMRS